MVTESTPTLIRCIGCGLPLGNAAMPPTKGALDHVRTCPQHPLAEEIRQTRDVMKRALIAGLAAGLLETSTHFARALRDAHALGFEP
jgi:hypothetical protein